MAADAGAPAAATGCEALTIAGGSGAVKGSMLPADAVRGVPISWRWMGRTTAGCCGASAAGITGRPTSESPDGVGSPGGWPAEPGSMAGERWTGVSANGVWESGTATSGVSGIWSPCGALAPGGSLGGWVATGVAISAGGVWAPGGTAAIEGRLVCAAWIGGVCGPGPCGWTSRWMGDCAGVSRPADGATTIGVAGAPSDGAAARGCAGSSPGWICVRSAGARWMRVAAATGGCGSRWTMVASGLGWCKACAAGPAGASAWTAASGAGGCEGWATRSMVSGEAGCDGCATRSDGSRWIAVASGVAGFKG